MKHLMIATLSFILMINVSCTHQESVTEKPVKQWFKGNLHTHSYWSDGDEFPEVIMEWYKSKGYQFVALSDHNILAKGDYWIEIADDSIYQKAFESYLSSYDTSWVKYRVDSGRIQVKLKTYEEYKGLFEEEGKFLIIQSEEITEQFENLPIHVNATNIQEYIDPQGGNSVSEILQNNIDEVIRQRERTGVPMIPHVNHPNFRYGISLEDMIVLKGERFFEVYNGHPLVQNLGDSAHMSTEEMWDRINISYLENNKPLIYGLATDDSHHYHVMGSKWSNAGRGWIMVETDSLAPSSLINAMEAGRFYATTGVILEKVEFDKNKLSVKIAKEKGVNYTMSFIGCRKGQSAPEELKVSEGTQASFDLTDDILFVRCRIVSSRLHSNPVENILYEMAWTQPVQATTQ